MKRKATHLFLIAALVFGITLTGSTAAFAEKWIHVKVNEKDDDTKVSVNLPMSLISAALAMIPEEVREEVDREMEVALNDVPFTWDDLQTFWDELRNAPEATFVTVQTRDETVEVRKEGDYVLVTTTAKSSDDGTEVDVKFPLAVIDALFSGAEGTLNFQAALAALADEGNGHIVSVRDKDMSVKVWIDDQNEAN